MAPPLVERIEHDGELLSMIVRAGYREPGVHFFTGGELSQQLGYLKHPADYTIEPHVHNPVRREVVYTQEVLVIQSGRLRVDFYTPAREYLESRVLCAGDVILLVCGGHGFHTLEPVEMIEVKQGPYIGDEDKTRFEGVDEDGIKLPREGA